jgi:hypothetical protein
MNKKQIKLSRRVMLPKNHRPVRPDLGEPFAKMLFDLRDLANESLMNNWSYTVTNRRIIAEAWMKKYPNRELAAEAVAMLKPYYKDLEF